MRFALAAASFLLLLPLLGSARQEPAKSAVADPELAKKLGADARGMRAYFLVILKTGTKSVPAGPERDEMFRGHFANMKRLAEAGKLAVAGPFGDKNDWRGMFVFAVDTQEEAEQLVATDPVVKLGEMTPEFHKLYATASLMAVNDVHKKIAPE